MSTSKKYWNSLIILLLTVFIVIASSLVYSVYTQENESIKNIDGAPVELGEETILYIKNSADGLNPEQRAEKISKELEGIFKIRAIDLDELDVEQRGENKVILLRNFLVTLTPQDVKSLENSQENSEIEIINKLKTGAKNYYEEQALESTVLSILIVF